MLRNVLHAILLHIYIYIDPCILIYKSDQVKDKSLAEDIVFDMLLKYRINRKREFFQLSKENIIKVIEAIKIVKNNDLVDRYIWNNQTNEYEQYLIEKHPKHIKIKVTKEDILNAPDVSNEYIESRKDNSLFQDKEQIAAIKKYNIKKF